MFLAQVEPVSFTTMLIIGILLSATTIILSELLRPDPDFQNAKPAGAGDFKFPTATEGREIPLIWGEVKLSGPNVTWWGDFRQVPQKETIKTGLWSKTRIITGYQYFVGIQMSFCQGGITPCTLEQVFIGDKDVPSVLTGFINEPNFLGGNDLGAGGIVGPIGIATGSLTQTRNAYLKNILAPAKISANRGTATIMFEGGYIGNTTQIKPWKGVWSRYPDALQLRAQADLGGGNPYLVGHHKVNGKDNNLAEVAYEILVDDDWGRKILPANIDIASFAAVAETLFQEGNGFGFQLENALLSEDLMGLVQEQMDGVVYFDRKTGKHTITLARQNYTIGSLQEINDDNAVFIKDFARQTWNGMTNQIRIGFTDRSRNYFDTFARSDSLANQRMQDGRIVTSTVNMPGCKNRTLANALAARTLRFLSFPLAKATIVVNREFWNANPGEVFRWTNSNLNLVDLPMRTIRVDFGDPAKGPITLGLVQDIFSLETGFFGEPPDPGWEFPEQGTLPIPVNEHQVFESPRKITLRDPVLPGPPNGEDRIFISARAQAGGVSLNLYLDPGQTGTFFRDGRNAGLFLIGSLNVGLNSEDANPTPSLQITGSPDLLARIDFAFDPEGATAAEIGQQLANIIKIGDEFIGVRTFVVGTGTFTTCYRGLLDSVIADHSPGDFVYLLWVAGGINDSQLAPGTIVDVRPRTVSRDEELPEIDAKTFTITMNNRYRRPYPPSRMDMDSARMAVSVDINPDVVVDWFRRSFENTDEVAVMEIDDPNIEASHENRVRILGDDGIIELVISAWITGTSVTLFRPDILRKANGVLPTAAQFRVKSRHDVNALVDLESLVELSQVSALTDTELAGLQNLGTLGASVASGGYTVVDDAVDHNFRLEGGTLSADVQFQLNGITGAWTQLIASGGSSGTITAAALSPGDVIFFRHLDNSDVGNNVMFFGDENGTDVLYGVLTDDQEWDQLQGYWSMDEVSDGSGLVDRVARFGSGTPDLVDEDMTESVAGQTNFGNAARILNSSGTIEHLRIANANAEPRIIPMGVFTVMCWVFAESGSFDGNFRSFVSCLDLANLGPGFAERVFHLSVNSTFQLVGVVHDSTGDFGGGGGARSVNNTMVEQQWIHIALAFDGTNYRVYTDGTVGPTVSGNILGTLNSTIQDFVVGGEDSGGTGAGNIDVATSQLDTRIDDLRMYHRTLSGGEIAVIAARGVPV